MSKGGGAPGFGPREWWGMYLRGRYEEAAGEMLGVLGHFRETAYGGLDRRGRWFVDLFLKHFLAIFTEEAFAIGRETGAEFVRHNATVANLAAVSSFGTTDAYLEMLRGRPGQLAKVLTLYSARNGARFEASRFFEEDAGLATVWYGAYAELYESGLIRGEVGERLRGHLLAPDARLDGGTSFDLYFGSTYVGEDCDRVVKPLLNRLASGRVSLPDLGTPDRGRVAVVSGNWSKVHSVYRTSKAFVEALRGKSHLTLVKLGERADVDVSGFDEVREVKREGDWSALRGSRFGLAYFPDVGLNTLSVLLANGRLAPVQVATAGHSVSTFGAEIDWWVSGKEVEKDVEPERNYSERLVLLSGAGAVHERPLYERKWTAGRVGERVVVNGPWTSPKVNAGFVETLAEVVRRVRRPLEFRMFAASSLKRHGHYLAFVSDLRARLGPANVIVKPGSTYDDYMSGMEEGDLGLDAFPFGGCNTVADALWLRKPTVCLEGDRWYGRIGPWMLRKAGLGELVARTKEEYVEIAVRLIEDEGWRGELRARLEGADLEGTVFAREEAGEFAELIGRLLGGEWV